jgi:hypothetical protein
MIVAANDGFEILVGFGLLDAGDLKGVALDMPNSR